jgi:hypothetical protein
MIKPLSSEGKMPARQDLSSFWHKVKRAIKGLGGDIRAADLEGDHLEILAPLILGDTAYDLVKNQSFDDWYSFEKMVEDRFGLSKRQILDAFFAMRPDGVESEA